MPRLRIRIEPKHLNDASLREGFSVLAHDDDAIQLVQAMGRLIESGDLGFWLSPRLMRKLKAFATEHHAEYGQQEVDDTLFLSWLEQGGNLEPNVRWDIESMPDNGGIYRILLEGGKRNESKNSTA